jgi:hypothetical protein
MSLIFLYRLITVVDIKNSILIFGIGCLYRPLLKISPPAYRSAPTFFDQSEAMNYIRIVCFHYHINNFIFPLSLYVCHASLAWTLHLLSSLT